MDTNEALKTLNFKYESEMYTNSEGISFLTLTSMICVGLFNLCRCGDHEYEMKKFREVLLAIQERRRLGNEHQIYLYLLDQHEFTDHGISVFSSWLTEKGEALLYLLNQWEEDEL